MNNRKMEFFLGFGTWFSLGAFFASILMSQVWLCLLVGAAIGSLGFIFPIPIGKNK